MVQSQRSSLQLVVALKKCRTLMIDITIGIMYVCSVLLCVEIIQCPPVIKLKTYLV